jgi:peptidoglycan-associated lipoprotein
MSVMTPLVSNAQCDNKYTADADKKYREGFFVSAVELYTKAADKAKKDPEAKACIAFQIAQCYRKIDDLKKATQAYQKAFKQGYSDPKGIWYFASILKKQGLYEDAKVQFDKYVKENPNDPRGPIAAKSCENAVKWIEKPTCYTVENKKDLNSAGNDFSPVFSSKKSDAIIFTSTREGAAGKPDEITGEIPEDLFEAKLDKKGAKFSKPVPLSEDINSKQAEGASTMNKKFNTLYFTRCSSEKKAKGKVGCQIYEVKRNGDKWSAPVKMELAADTFVTGHPTLSADGNVMVFASNMPGGKGGMDLWMAKYDKKKKTFANPVNLGDEVNTASNEMYPFLRLDNRLYFSSDKLEGMGGMDIYKAEEVTAGQWGKADNMRYPMNSEGDDFGIVFKGNEESGMFASNRKGGKGKDDIYTFGVTKSSVTMIITVKDENTKLPIAGAKVEAVNSAGEKKEYTTDGNGKITINPAPYNEDYGLTGTKVNYFSGKSSISTKGIDPVTTCKDTTVSAEILIKPFDVPLNYEVLFEFNRCYYYPEFVDTLDKIVKVLKENPTMRVELGAHTDARGDAKNNDTLAACRAREVVKYIISKGIETERLVAKGYGEREPRVMEKDMEGFTKGQVLDEKFIASLSKEEDRERAHKLNRRVTMKKIDYNFVPKSAPVEPKKEDKDE